MEMHKKYKDTVLKEHNVKFGFMSASAKVCTLALKEIPAANASIKGDEIVYRDYVDLSVAVATPKGLVTPVVRNTESMGFIDIKKEIAALGKKVNSLVFLLSCCSELWALGSRWETHVGGHGWWNIYHVCYFPTPLTMCCC
jgi:hypothetical protein